MSKISYYIATIALLAAAWSTPASARGIHTNEAKFYGPGYGWRYSPPPARASETACSWKTVRAKHDGHSVVRLVRRC